MKIINVVEQERGIITNIESFIVHEEQLSQDVVDDAEKFFIEVVKDMDSSISEDDLEYHLEEGSYDNLSGYSVDIIWSYAN